jgi:hypothetical protein
MERYSPGLRTAGTYETDNLSATKKLSMAAKASAKLWSSAAPRSSGIMLGDDRAERLAEPRLAVVPSFAWSARAVASAAGGHDHELLVSEIAPGPLRNDPVEPRLEGARRRKIVEREPD